LIKLSISDLLEIKGGADEFEKMINEDALKWARVIERAKIIID